MGFFSDIWGRHRAFPLETSQPRHWRVCHYFPAISPWYPVGHDFFQVRIFWRDSQACLCQANPCETLLVFKGNLIGQIALQNGIPIANAAANVAFNQDNKVVAFGSSFVKPSESFVKVKSRVLTLPQRIPLLRHPPFLLKMLSQLQKSRWTVSITDNRPLSSTLQKKMDLWCSATPCKYGTKQKVLGTMRLWMLIPESLYMWLTLLQRPQ